MKLNIHFFVLLFIACIAFVNDILIYLFNLNYNISLIISTIILTFISIILIKNKKIKGQSDFDKIDLIFFVLLGIIFAIRIVVPDFSYDTLSYHIYLQENPFIDKINFDFFAGRTINAFLFPLGDRMFYIFRFLLGYRLGTILSYYSVIVMFYQVKELLKILKENMNKIAVFIISTSILAIFSINMWIGTYYIDIFSAVFVLEIILTSFKYQDLFTDKKKLYYIALITGISTGIKLPNLLIKIPIYLFILKDNIKDIKKIKLLDIFICIMLFLLPFSIYMIDNIIQTGSPIFPYYNKIFKSVFFGNINWQDSNFGCNNIFLSLIWPIIVTVFPKKGYEVAIEVDYILGIGFITAIVLIIQKLIKKNKNKKIFSFACLVIVMTIVWSNFMMGYVRYAIVLVVMCWIMFSIVLYEIFCKYFSESKQMTAIYYVFIFAMIFLNTIIYNCGWFTLSESNNYYNNYYFSNFKRIVNDRNVEKIPIDGVWVAIGDDSATVSMVREKNTPIYNFDKWLIETSPVTIKMYNDKIKNNKLYTIIELDRLERKIYKLNENNLKIVEIIEKYEDLSFVDANNTYYLVRLEYAENDVENELIIDDNEIMSISTN